nr:transposase, MuDR, MULE transposase domain protein [Tanacetum cinerariifolium]
KVGKIFDNKEALDLAIRLKALDEGYQFLNDRSAPERHAAIALAVQDEFPLSYHAVCCRHLMMNLSLKRDKINALF